MRALAVFLLTVFGGANFPNYSHASQFISQLGASDAPNARMIILVSGMNCNYTLLNAGPSGFPRSGQSLE